MSRSGNNRAAASRSALTASVGRDRSVPAVLLACVLWGTTGTVAHQAPAGSLQIVVGMSTFGFGGVLLFGLKPCAALATLSRRRDWPLLLLGACGVIAYASLYYESMKLAGVAVGNVTAIGSGPVFVAGLEFFADRRRGRGAGKLATAVTVIGVVLLGTAGASGPGQHAAFGIVCALGAGGGYAVYSWAGGHLIARTSSRWALTAMFFAASLVLIPALLLIGLGPLTQLRGVVVLIYLAAIPMAGAYLLFGYGLREMAASTATTLALAEPLVATVLATTVLDEHLSLQAWIGMAIIGISLVVVAALERRRLAPAPLQDSAGAGF